MDNQLTNQLNAVRHFDIEAQDIPGALLQFGEQAELTVMVHHNANGNTPGLKGEYPTDEALQQLLAGTGLEYRIKGEAIIVTRLVAELTPEPRTTKAPLLKRLGRAIATAIFATSGTGAIAAAQDAATADAATAKEPRYIEEIIVTAERGQETSIERSMTVTGFNEDMIEQLGINNTNDLEALTPGLQMGHESPDSNHGNHIYMRGIGSQRNQELFSDTAVATYVDGVYTDEIYGLEPGNLFDVERVEVARGPQGTTGGRAAIAGSINFTTKKPTDEFEVKVLSEFTDQISARVEAVIGGPIGDSGFMYRIRAGRWVGDGAQNNRGTGGDYDKPDSYSFAPQLRYRNDRWDVNLAWSHREDRGTPRTSVPLVPLDTTTECFLMATGPGGNRFCFSPNPFFGTDKQLPSVEDCVDSFSVDDVVCDADDLKNEIAFNTRGNQDNELDNYAVDVAYKLNEQLTLHYKFAAGETTVNASTDTDKSSRVGGGICPGETTPSPYCATDGFGSFSDARTNYARYNEQQSHEIRLISNFNGAFNFTSGLYYRDGEEPYVARLFEIGGVNPEYTTDQTAACNDPALGLRAIFTFFNFLSDHSIHSTQASGGLWSCPGSPEEIPLISYSDVPGITEPTTGNVQGHWVSFFANTSFESRAAYFNADYQMTEKLTLFAGIRYDLDTKTFEQHTFRVLSNLGLFAAHIWLFRSCETETYDWKCDRDWEEFTGNVGLEYRFVDDRMVYARISRGARAGGFNGSSLWRDRRLGTFDSETLINYEVGLKGLFFDNRAQLETSVFYQDYQDHWVHATRLREPAERRPGESIFEGETTTIDGTWIAGLEIAGALRITDRLTLRGFYSYLDSEYGPFATAYCCDERQPAIPIEFVNFDGSTQTVNTREPIEVTGNRLPNQPRHKYSLTLLYDTPAPLGSLTLLGTINYTGEKHPDFSNLDRFIIPDYTRIDLRAIWLSPSENIQVTAFVKNALNEIAVQQFRPNESNTGAFLNGSLTDEREIGLSVLWSL